MTRVRLQNIAKYFGATLALNDISLDIAPGELFFLLGPSGCGKSTLLRLIAGLHVPTSGNILFNDRDVTQFTTARRNAVMCFQSYALWPHMSVRDNIRFGLNVRRMSKAEQETRLDEVLALSDMTAYAQRKPNELSGGQQQRVALARALAVRPDCLLLDEPLSNLDARMRLKMRSQIRHICKSAHLTTIYVTHDQKEALSTADRIAVMNAGRLVQVGTPVELYQRPRSSFVADFLGAANLIPARRISQKEKQVEALSDLGAIGAVTVDGAALPEKFVLCLRPEQIRLRLPGDPPTDGVNRLRGRVLENTFLGESSEQTVQVGNQTLKIVSTPPWPHEPGDVLVEFAPEDTLALQE